MNSMSSIDQLKERLRGKTAEETVDALLDKGALNDHLAQRYVIVDEYERRLCNTGDEPREIQEDLADDYGICRKTVYNYVGK